MKELSIEEKAKRYDEAIEKFDVILNLNTVKVSGTIFADDVIKILPELAESENEKIRKWCISHFRECFRVTKDNVEYQEYLNNKVIPWLKKQVEKKPAWSEEDENKVTLFMQLTEGCDNEEELVDWLKFLKDRVGCEVNCTTTKEWSEEDEYYLNSCITKIEIDIQNWDGHGKTMIDADKEIISWLKSLKNRYTWKPSDKQMKAIGHICDGNYNVDLDILDSIYRDFKKLREE